MMVALIAKKQEPSLISSEVSFKHIIVVIKTLLNFKYNCCIFRHLMAYYLEG